MTQKTSTNKRCRACVRQTMHKELYKKNGCPVWCCTVCGLGEANSNDFDPAAYYTEDYFDGNHADGYSDYAGSEKVLRIEFARVVNELKQHCQPGSRILEIGSAYGFFLKEAQAIFDTHGIELCEEGVEACHRAGLSNVHQGMANQETLQQAGTVDAVVMLDVIEHLPDPFAVLHQCNEILNPGGVILISTGDFGSLVARLMGRHWRLMTPPQHLWFFSRKSFECIASTLDLSVVAYSRPWKFVPISLVLFQVARMTGFRKQSSLTQLSQKGIPINLFDTMRIILRKPLGIGK